MLESVYIFRAVASAAMILLKDGGADGADNAGGITFDSDTWSETVFGTFGFLGA